MIPSRSPVDQLRLCDLTVAYFEAAVDIAIDDLIEAPIFNRSAERARLAYAEAKLEQAIRRRDRARCEAEGKRWLTLIQGGRNAL